jgi:hypothetical protein
MQPVESEAAEAIQAELQPVSVEEETKPAGEQPEPEGEHAKDGVSLDELFKLKPEIFQNAGAASDEDDQAKRKIRR